jgi:hypothetical protein
VVDQLADLFHTTHRVKTQQVVKSQGQHCGDIELAGYLQNEVGTVPLVVDLRIAHERWGSNTDPTLNGHLHYPNYLLLLLGYIVNLYEFYSYKVIGKLTIFLQRQESSFRKIIVEVSTTAARHSPV